MEMTWWEVCGPDTPPGPYRLPAPFFSHHKPLCHVRGHPSCRLGLWDSSLNARSRQLPIHWGWSRLWFASWLAYRASSHGCMPRTREDVTSGFYGSEVAVGNPHRRHVMSIRSFWEGAARHLDVLGGEEWRFSLTVPILTIEYLTLCYFLTSGTRSSKERLSMVSVFHLLPRFWGLLVSWLLWVRSWCFG